MVFSVPLSLIAWYAFFWAFEHLGLKIQQECYAVESNRSKLWPLGFLGLILLPARVFAWAALLYFGWRAHWYSPLILIAIAFPLSLAYQFFAAALYQLPRQVFFWVVMSAIAISIVAITQILSSF